MTKNKWQALLVMSILIFLLTPSVSAWEFDNVYNYDEETKTVDIRNSVLGIPFLQLSKIAGIKLNSNHIEYVGVGEGIKVAEINVNNYEEYLNAFKEVNSYDINNDGKAIYKEYVLKYKEITGEELIDSYEWTCEELANSSIHCYNKLIKKSVDTFDWIALDSELNSLHEGNLTIGIFTNVEKGEHTEWIPTFFGVKIDEWAEFIGASRYEYYTPQDINLTVGVYSNDSYAQTFRIGTNGTNESFSIFGVSVMGYRTWTNATAVNLTLCIYSTNETTPITQIVCNSSDTGADSNSWANYLPTSSGHMFNISMPSSNLGKGGMYAAVIFGNYSYAGGDTFEWRGRNPGLYEGGSLWSSGIHSYPNEWNISGNGLSDTMFEVWGTPIPPAYMNISSPTNKTYIYQTIGLNVTANETINQWIWSNDSGLNNRTFTPNITIVWELGQHTLDVWGNNTAGIWRNASVTFVVGADVYSETYSNTTYDTEEESYILNLTFRTAPTNGKFYYNGSYHSTTITNTGGDNYSINRTIIMNSTGTKNFFFSYDIGSANFNSSVRNQVVNPLIFGLCNSTLTVPYVNFTFKDEDNSSSINANIDSSDWTYWISKDINTNKTFSFFDAVENYSYAFCFSPSHKNLQVILSIEYDSTGYVQRDYSFSGNYTNSTTNTTLYLLSTSDGIYVTYQVVSPAEQPIEDVYVNVTREIGGVTEFIGSGYTGGDGGITFWLNPDYSHTLTFEKEGYNTEVLTHTPTQSSYTIYLGSTVTTNVSDYSRGISYMIEPLNKTLRNETTYTFNFTISSSYWALDQYGFYLTNSTGAALGSNLGATATGGTTTYDLNTANHTQIIMEFFWYTNSTYSNATTSWYVTYTADEGFSIWRFFQDLKKYTGTGEEEGIFGLDEWSRALIVFIFIFGMIGIASYWSGIYSPAAVLIELFALVAFFDIGLEMVPNPVGAINHFPTVFIAILLLGYLFMEWKG